MFKKTASLLLVILWLSSAVSDAAEAQVFQVSAGPRTRSLAPVYGSRISPDLQQRLRSAAPGSQLAVIVIFNTQAVLGGTPSVQDRTPSRLNPGRSQSAVETLQTVAVYAQNGVQRLLSGYQQRGQVERVVPFWIFNGMSVTAAPEVIQALAARPEVYRIEPEVTFHAPAMLAQASPLSTNSVNDNIRMVNAPALWAQGYRGQGVVVATLDTGVDLTHPDLAAQWRGGTNSWFDPYYQHASPVDAAGSSSGHGTAVMSVILGRDAGGSAIGVAPDATWIAARLYNDLGMANATAVHQALQWLLDPDGNPMTSDAPQVVNNSWAFNSPVCDLSFQLDLQALRAAGILPIFSAGNYGPNDATGASPANYPEAFSVGAVDNQANIASFSSRGPNACGQSPSIYPDIVAPGVNIPVASPSGGYSVMSGTSFAAPHAAGVLALLFSAHPWLSLTEQQDALIHGGPDLGAAGPDNTFGYSYLDASGDLNWLTASPNRSRFYLPIIFH